MSTSHIFYIPVLILVGFFAGFFVGQRALEQEQKRARRKRARSSASPTQPDHASSSDEPGA